MRRGLAPSGVLLAPYRRLAYSKRFSNKGINLNKGILTRQERGDRFTEREVYANTNDAATMVKAQRKEGRLLKEQRQSQRFSGISAAAERDLHSGSRPAASTSELDAAQWMDDAVAEGQDTHAEPYSNDIHAALSHEVARRDHMMDKFGQAPTSREFYQLFRQLRSTEEDEEIITTHQRRLADEYGIYPTTRMDAFMLGDESCYPAWVHALPYRLRDQVKYGAMGVTEEDEALRVRLGRMPYERRQAEWKRLKSAKEYQTAREETLTVAELRQARQGKRRFHWLQRKREKRASMLRRMALRKPEGYEAWPSSSAVDYSQRLSFIAQHVENGVETKGTWPLNKDDLLRAKIKRQQHEAERTFLLSAEEKKLTSRKNLNGGIQELLSSFDKPAKTFKKLSRKVYANRVNAIVHGDQDEYGRQYRTLRNRSTRRQRAHNSLEEIRLDAESRQEPRVYVQGLNNADDEKWTKHYKSWADGMPSTRYAS